MFLGGLGTKEQPRILEQPLAYGLRTAQESRAQLADIAAAQLRPDDRLGQVEAVLAVAASDRQQVAHRRMGRNLSKAHVLLDLGREIADQPQMSRNPAQALVHPLSQLLKAQAFAAQCGQQPALLDRRGPRRAPLAAVQQQGLGVLELPQRRPDRVDAQKLETAKAPEAVDDPVKAFPLHDDDGHLLALLGQRGQQATLVLRATQAQVLVAAIELVKFQLHTGSSWASPAQCRGPTSEAMAGGKSNMVARGPDFDRTAGTPTTSWHLQKPKPGGKTVDPARQIFELVRWLDQTGQRQRLRTLAAGDLGAQRIQHRPELGAFGHQGLYQGLGA